MKFLFTTLILFMLCFGTNATPKLPENTVQATCINSETTPRDTVFSSHFNSGNPMEQWTSFDRNADGNTWNGDTSVPGITYDGEKSNAANDLLMTPAIKLTSGKDYVIDFNFVQSGAFDPDSISIVKCDKSGNYSDANIICSRSVYLDNGLGKYSESVRFSCTATGECYFGIIISSTTTNGKLSLSAFSVRETDKAIPDNVSELTGKVDASQQKVQLKWRNPQKDTEGMKINGMIDIDIFENGKLVKTLNNCEPDRADSCTFTPIKSEGLETFVVKARMGTASSPGVEITLNLDDLAGELLLLKAFEVNSVTSQDWKIEDLAGNSSWAYDYSNIFSLVYKLGQHDNDWLFSPMIELSKEHRYVATYELKTSRRHQSSIDFSIGTAQSHTAVSEIIASHQGLKQNGFGLFKTKQFAVASDGSFSFGFHVYDDQYTVSMRNLCIYYIDAVISGVTNVAIPVQWHYDAQSSTLCAEDAVRAVVYTLQGNEVAQFSLQSNSANLSSLERGIYIVNVHFSNGEKVSFKIVK